MPLQPTSYWEQWEVGATLSFYAAKDGKIVSNFSDWEQNKVVLEGQVFEAR